MDRDIQTKIMVSDTNIHIENSFTIRKRVVMRFILSKVAAENPSNSVVKSLSMYEMINEWRFHNRLYYLGIEKDRTKSVDINMPIKWYIRIIYWIFGI